MDEPSTLLIALRNWDLSALGNNAPSSAGSEGASVVHAAEFKFIADLPNVLEDLRKIDERNRGQRGLSLVSTGIVALNRVVSGEAELTESERALAVALAKAAHPGQAVISSLDINLNELDFNQTSTVTLGQFVLDLDLPPLEVWQVDSVEAGRIFPPLNSEYPVRHNLQSRRDPFFGRFYELEILHDLVRHRRLITLWGDPGIGKSSLAWRLAIELAPDVPKGAWLLKLHRETTHESILADVAPLLGVPVDRFFDDERKTDFGGRALLVLDGCNQCISEATIAVEELLATLPDAQIITTSQSPLAIAEETPFWVGPMQLPPESGNLSPNKLLSFDAVRLLVDKLEQLDPTWSLNLENAQEIVEICHLFAGNSRSLLSCAHTFLKRGLDDVRRVAFSRGDSQEIPVHSISELQKNSGCELSANAVALLSAARVFVGDWTVDALRAVSTDLDMQDHQSALSELIDQNILEVRFSNEGVIRLSIPFSDQHHLQDWTRSVIHDDPFVRRHAEYYAALAERHANDVSDQFRPIRRNIDNIRLAISRSSVDDSATDSLLRLVVALGLYWHSRGQSREGLALLKRACHLASGSGHPLVARAHNILGTFLTFCANHSEAIAVFEAAEELAMSHADELTAALAQGNLATSLRQTGQLESALEYGLRAEAKLRSMDEPRRLAAAISNVGTIYEEMLLFKEAEASFRSSADIFRELGESWSVVRTEYNLAELARNQRDFEKAMNLHARNLIQATEIDDADLAALNLEGLALCIHGKEESFLVAGTLLGIASNVRIERGCPPSSNQFDRIQGLNRELSQILGEDRLKALAASSCSLTPSDGLSLLSLLEPVDAFL